MNGGANGWYRGRGDGSAPSGSGGARHRRKSTRADEILDPDALTIGFARRFATYKRATLIFRDLPRLQRILTDTSRPVQIDFRRQGAPAGRRRQGTDPPDHWTDAGSGNSAVIGLS